MCIKDLVTICYLDLTIPDNPFNQGQKRVTAGRGRKFTSQNITLYIN